MDGIQQRYFPVENRWAFVSPIALDPAALQLAKDSARRTQQARLSGRKAGPMRDAIRASIKALDEGRIQVFLSSERPDDFRTIFKATTKERPDRSFHFPKGMR